MMPDSEMSAPEGTDTQHGAQADTTKSSGYASACDVYWGLGWRCPIPVDPADKGGVPKGFTGYDGVDMTRENMAWFAKSKPGHNIGLRLPDGLIGIDVDAYDPKTGEATLAEAEKRWGTLPPTYRSTSRDDGISGIRLFTVPAGTVLKTEIEFPELGIKHIEIIQRHHRHVQCRPSIHDKTGRTYRWISELDGSVMDTPPAPGDLPELPPEWLAELRVDPPPHNGAVLGSPASVDVQTALTEGAASHRVAARLCDAINDCHGPERQPHTLGHVLALLRFGTQGDTGVRPALKTLGSVYVDAVGPDRRGGHRAAGAEFDRMVFGKNVGTLLAEPDYGDWFDEIPTADTALPADTGAEPTTWEAHDLGPYLRGEVEQPEPSLGIARSDGQRLSYPSREHSILGETESGKTWFALGCVAAELMAGNDVVYLHFEEPDPTSTIERLRLLGVPADVLAARLRFVAPSRPLKNTEWLAALLDPTPSLVVYDGVNEGMALHGHDIMTAEGAALFRRWLIRPCIEAGAAALSCDHLPKVRDGHSRDAYGSVHKGNALDGARFVLENVTPFGRGLRGVSHVFVTKDRPGHLRAHGRPTKVAGKTYLGTMVADDEDPFTPFSLMLYAPKDDDETATKLTATLAEIADWMYEVVCAQPDRTVPSRQQLYAAMREAGHLFREAALRSAAENLVHAGRFIELPGRRGATSYQAVSTTSAGSEDQ
jgi:hypothetical protein